MTPIDFNESKQACIEYFGGDEMAAQVWQNKYALKDSEGNLYEKTPADMHHRIAGLGNIAHYLGVGTEINLLALKHQLIVEFMLLICY